MQVRIPTFLLTDSEAEIHYVVARWAEAPAPCLQDGENPLPKELAQGIERILGRRGFSLATVSVRFELPTDRPDLPRVAFSMACAIAILVLEGKIASELAESCFLQLVPGEVDRGPDKRRIVDPTHLMGMDRFDRWIILWKSWVSISVHSNWGIRLARNETALFQFLLEGEQLEFPGFLDHPVRRLPSLDSRPNWPAEVCSALAIAVLGRHPVLALTRGRAPEWNVQHFYDSLLLLLASLEEADSAEGVAVTHASPVGRLVYPLGPDYRPRRTVGIAYSPALTSVERPEADEHLRLAQELRTKQGVDVLPVSSVRLESSLAYATLQRAYMKGVTLYPRLGVRTRNAREGESVPTYRELLAKILRGRELRRSIGDRSLLSTEIRHWFDEQPGTIPRFTPWRRAVLSVASTIADLEGAPRVHLGHVEQALAFQVSDTDMSVRSDFL